MDVRLVSTSGHKNFLKRLSKRDGTPSNVYSLKTDDLDKVRVGYFKDKYESYNRISHIDPPGGPRITVGKTIKNTTLPVVESIMFMKSVNRYIIIFVEQ